MKKRCYPLVCVLLDDHASYCGHKMMIGQSGHVLCSTTGYLVKEDAYSYYICHWVSESLDAEENEYHRVMKGTCQIHHTGVEVVFEGKMLRGIRTKVVV